MMFPKPPKKEKKQPKKLIQKTPLKAKTGLKQYKKLEARTPLKQTKALKAKTKLKQNATLEVKSSLKQNVKLKIGSKKLAEKKAIYKVKQIRTNKRAIFSDFTKEEKAHIMKRDNEKCIYCGGTTYLGIAHIFASRQKGGVGNRKNGVVLCQICHGNLDNGKDEILRNKIQNYCEEYLKNIYGNIKKEDLIYDKYNNNDKKII